MQWWWASWRTKGNAHQWQSSQSGLLLVPYMETGPCPSRRPLAPSRTHFGFHGLCILPTPRPQREVFQREAGTLLGGGGAGLHQNCTTRPEERPPATRTRQRVTEGGRSDSIKRPAETQQTSTKRQPANAGGPRGVPSKNLTRWARTLRRITVVQKQLESES